MAKISNSGKGLLIFCGIIFAIVLILLAILFSSIKTPLWQSAGSAFLVFSIFGSIIFIGLRKHRVRRIIDPFSKNYFGTESSEALRIPLNETRMRWKKLLHQSGYVSVIDLFILVFTLNFIFGSKFFYQGNFLQAMLVMNGGIFLLVCLVFTFRNNTLSKAQKLVADLPKRELLVDATGLAIPIELVTEPALHIAVDAGETEVFLAWASIAGWEVNDGMGNSPAQHSLSVLASNKYSGIFHRFGLIRSAEVLRDEPALIALARRHLNCPVKWAGHAPAHIDS